MYPLGVRTEFRWAIGELVQRIPTLGRLGRLDLEDLPRQLKVDQRLGQSLPRSQVISEVCANIPT